MISNNYNLCDNMKLLWFFFFFKLNVTLLPAAVLQYFKWFGEAAHHGGSLKIAASITLRGEAGKQECVCVFVFTCVFVCMRGSPCLTALKLQ